MSVNFEPSKRAILVVIMAFLTSHAVAGTAVRDDLGDVVELEDHPWMLATQFHPEFKSRPNYPHPLFCEFIRAAKETLREGAQHPLRLQE